MPIPITFRVVYRGNKTIIHSSWPDDLGFDPDAIFTGLNRVDADQLSPTDPTGYGNRDPRLANLVTNLRKFLDFTDNRSMSVGDQIITSYDGHDLVTYEVLPVGWHVSHSADRVTVTSSAP